VAKLTQFENPFSGKKASIFDFSQIWSMILGVFIMFFVFAMGQRVANTVSTRLPVVDTSIEPIIRQPQAQGIQKQYV
jgi:hypothetical protein